MDDAAHFAPVFRPHRHHIAAVADGHHRVLQEFVGGGIFDDGVQLGADAVLGLADLAAKIPQRHTGGVCHFLRREDGIGDLPFQHRLG